MSQRSRQLNADEAKPKNGQVLLDEFISQAGSFYRELFARGYIVSDHKPIVPAWWIGQEPFDGYFICHDPRLIFTQSGVNQSSVLCLGIIFDSRFPAASSQDTLNALAAALDESERAFHDQLSHSSGRYVLIYKRGGAPAKFLTDATGMRCALYYNQECRVISSHARLIQINSEHAPDSSNPYSPKFGYPGIKTPLDNVYFLSPNTLINMDSFSVERYWPITHIEQLDTEVAAEQFRSIMRNSFQWINSNFNTVTSLTAGMDSRATLSIAKRNTRYFTYFRDKSEDTDALDIEFAKKVSHDLNINHTIIHCPSLPKPPIEFSNLQKINNIYLHLPNMPYRYGLTLGGGEDIVHVRSNLSEIGRLFYHNKRKVYPRSATSLTKLWSSNTERHTSRNILAFDEYAEITHFFDAPVERTSLFYWEHRMGGWHSQVVTGTDIVFETLSLYNCRQALILMLSVPTDAQKSSEILRRTIASEWPELMEYPVNGKPFQRP